MIINSTFSLYFECTRLPTLRKPDWDPGSLVNLMITECCQALDLRAFRQVWERKTSSYLDTFSRHICFLKGIHTLFTYIMYTVNHFPELPALERMFLTCQGLLIMNSLNTQRANWKCETSEHVPHKMLEPVPRSNTNDWILLRSNSTPALITTESLLYTPGQHTSSTSPASFSALTCFVPNWGISLVALPTVHGL